MVWKELKNRGELVGGRSYSSLVLYKNSLFVYGGRMTFPEFNNDVYCYDLNQESWKLIKTNSKLVPPKRYAHSTIHPSDSHFFYIYGGLGDLELGDVWRFDMDGFYLNFYFYFNY